MKPWAEKFYKSRTWQKCRAAFLNSKGYICERCDENIANIAHHKKYLNPQNINDVDVSLSWDNLEALCEDCHAKAHTRKTEARYTFDSFGNLLPPVKKT